MKHIVLDSSSLGVLSNPAKSEEVKAIMDWNEPWEEVGVTRRQLRKKRIPTFWRETKYLEKNRFVMKRITLEKVSYI